MPIDLKKCCGTHSKEKEDNGECCQTKEKDDGAQALYEHSLNVEPTTKDVEKLKEKQRAFANGEH